MPARTAKSRSRRSRRRIAAPGARTRSDPCEGGCGSEVMNLVDEEPFDLG